MKLCAIVPSHDHHTEIGAVVEHCRRAGLPVFVIDDGSGEPAASVIASLHNPEAGVTVRRLEINQGKGGAVMEGFRLASAAGFTHAVQVDSDGQHDLDALPRLLEAARANPEALISGAPSYDESMPLGRRMGRWITHVWVWIETLSFQITDTMCGFRVYPLAPVTALLAGRELGRRMQFDIEIMVRLFWAGVPVVMVPVKVIYPPGNSSNFDVLRDNVRISAMHTKLVLGMLWRLPMLLGRRLWPPAKKDEGRSEKAGASHWPALAERGALWGLRFCAFSYRLLGRAGCLAVLMPVVLYFYLAGSEHRRGARLFLGRALNRRPSLLEGYRLYLSFAARTLDGFIAWSGGYASGMVIPADAPALKAAFTDPRGAVIVVAHLGNNDLSRALMEPEMRKRLTLFVHTSHAANYNRVLARFCPDAMLNLFQVTEIGPDTIILMKERISRGEWVVIAGDRTPVLSKGRVSRVPFLGADAPFPDGPWILASLIQCPVYLLFCLREGAGWRLTLEPFADRITLPRTDREAGLRAYIARYAERLGDYARADPFQWYNFYDFWAQ